jgi:O-antigen ligase
MPLDATASPLDARAAPRKWRDPWPRIALGGLFAGVLVGYPLIISLSILAGIPTRLPAVAVRAMVLLVAILILVAPTSNRSAPHADRRWLLLSFLSFWALYLCRLFVDLGWRHIITDRPPLEYVSFTIGASLIPAVAVIAARYKRIVLPTDRVIFALATAVSLLASTAILFSVVKGTAEGDVASGRLGIDTLNPITVGELAGISIVLGVRLLLVVTTSLRIRILVALASIASSVALIASGARGPLLATLLSVVVLLLTHPMRALRRAKMIAISLMLTLIIALATPVLGDDFGLTVTERIAVLVGSGRDESIDGRLERLSSATSDFALHPLTGSAVTTSATRDYPHNVIIEAFMATGILGGVLILIVIVAGTRTAWRMLSAPESAQPVWPATIFPTVLVTALISGSIAYSSVLWVTIASLIALKSEKRDAQINANRSRATGQSIR